MAVGELQLTNVSVHRGRAEEFWGTLSAPVVTARAVAPVAELARWCLPLVRPGGCLLAIRGARSGEELKANRAVLERLGATEAVIEQFGSGVVDPQTTVLRVVLGVHRPGHAATRVKKARDKRHG